MICNGCGNADAYRMFMSSGFECCDKCGSLSTSLIPDVYWDGKPEHGLADDPRSGTARVFGSKREKALYLREKGLVEAGGKYHGAPVTFFEKTDTAAQKRNNRHLFMEARRKAESMGKDVARQSVLKVIHDYRKAVAQFGAPGERR